MRIAHDSINRRIFISEFIAGGGWPNGELPASLLDEGRRMLVAVVQDALLGGAERVSVTLDARVPALAIHDGRLRVVRVTSAAEESEQFESLARDADDVFVIAPEFHGLLEERVRRVEELSRQNHGRPKHRGCSSAAIALCGDKWHLARCLVEHGIPTLPTELFDPAAPGAAFSFPIVIKPRDGAGSVLTFLVRDAAQLANAVREIRQSDESFEFIQQPFVQGRPLSQSVLNRVPYPLTEQLLSEDDRLSYLGSRIVRDATLAMATQAMVARCGDCIPGLDGYVGFDLLLPDDGQPLLVVEINPRLTTSYELLRELLP